MKYNEGMMRWTPHLFTFLVLPFRFASLISLLQSAKKRNQKFAPHCMLLWTSAFNPNCFTWNISSLNCFTWNKSSLNCSTVHQVGNKHRAATLPVVSRNNHKKKHHWQTPSDSLRPHSYLLTEFLLVGFLCISRFLFPLRMEGVGASSLPARCPTASNRLLCTVIGNTPEHHDTCNNR